MRVGDSSLAVTTIFGSTGGGSTGGGSTGGGSTGGGSTLATPRILSARPWHRRVHAPAVDTCSNRSPRARRSPASRGSRRDQQQLHRLGAGASGPLRRERVGLLEQETRLRDLTATDGGLRLRLQFGGVFSWAKHSRPKGPTRQPVESWRKRACSSSSRCSFELPLHSWMGGRGEEFAASCFAKRKRLPVSQGLASVGAFVVVGFGTKAYASLFRILSSSAQPNSLQTTCRGSGLDRKFKLPRRNCAACRGRP